MSVVGRQRNYLDTRRYPDSPIPAKPGYRVPDSSAVVAPGGRIEDSETVIEWDDPLERAAIVFMALRHMTPPDAVGSISSTGREQLAYTWLRNTPGDRQRYRRQADAVIDVYVTGGMLVAGP